MFKTRKKKGISAPAAYPKDVKFLYFNNRQFLTDRSLKLPYLNEVMKNIRDQNLQTRSTAIIIVVLGVMGAWTVVCGGITWLPMILRDITPLSILIAALLLAGLLYGVLMARWAFVYLYEFFRFSRHDENGEKTYNALLSRGRVSTAKITFILKTPSNVTIYYRYNNGGVPVTENYTTRNAISLKANDRIFILHNAVVSILL